MTPRFYRKNTKTKHAVGKNIFTQDCSFSRTYADERRRALARSLADVYGRRLISAATRPPPSQEKHPREPSRLTAVTRCRAYIYEVVLRDACACPSVCICDNRCQQIQPFKENLIKTPYSHEGQSSSAAAAAFLSHLAAESLLQPPRRSIQR